MAPTTKHAGTAKSVFIIFGAILPQSMTENKPSFAMRSVLYLIPSYKSDTSSQTLTRRKWPTCKNKVNISRGRIFDSFMDHGSDVLKVLRQEPNIKSGVTS